MSATKLDTYMFNNIFIITLLLRGTIVNQYRRQLYFHSGVNIVITFYHIQGSLP